MTMRMGVDIGGTFTDFVLIDEDTGQVSIEKCLTTPRQPDQAIYTGIAQMEKKFFDGKQIKSDVIHATTLITNAIIERKGAKTALITTTGFRDILEMGRETRYYVYDLNLEFPKPIVPRALRRCVKERTVASGTIVEAIDEREIEQLVKELHADGVRAIAVMFIHSYRNPENELKVRKIIERVAPDIQVSLSHEVISQPKEYERLSTTVLDAYVKPATRTYMNNLLKSLTDSGHASSLSIMLSNGGISPIEIASRYPIQLVESGPAAGVEAGRYYGDLLNLDRVLAFDMGGTTAKLCLIRDGKVGRTREFEVARMQRFRHGSGYPLAVSVYSLLEIGAGGGSIARINNLGLLAVGPESSGSEPGPACYGRGGTQPTVTDADVVLGFLDPQSFLGGEFKLDEAAARSAIDNEVAKPLGTPVDDAAWGIFDLVTETMASAARLHLAERGEDPTRCALFASGGAGPVHAVALARRLECHSVIIPPMPGVMSAFGLLAARSAFEVSRSVRIPASGSDHQQVEDRFEELEREAKGESGISGKTQIERFVELRHRGQESAVEVETVGSWKSRDVCDRAIGRFGDEYHQLYGRRGDETPLEISTLRVVVSRVGSGAKPPQQPVAAIGTRRKRRVRFGSETIDDVQVIPRHTLAVGERVSGPAIIEERESTTVVWPGDEVTVHTSTALIVKINAAKSSN